jgi:hypothetical protein
MKKLSDEIRQMTIDMENGPVKSNDVYTLLLRAMLEIDRLSHEIKVLNDKKI